MEILNSTFGSSLAGAFFGALAAFIFGLIVECIKDKRAKYRILLRTQTVLLMQLGGLFDKKDSSLLPLIEALKAHSEIPRVFQSYVTPSLPLNELVFIAEFKGSAANVIQNLMLSQQTFENCECFMETLGAKMDNLMATKPLGGALSLEPSSYEGLTRLTLNGISVLDEGIELLKITFLEVEQILEKHFDGYARIALPGTLGAKKSRKII